MLPIRMLLTCPSCCSRHIDEGRFASKPHHTHECQVCGLVWRPAIENTVGVQLLFGPESETRKLRGKLNLHRLEVHSYGTQDNTVHCKDCSYVGIR